jgi:hypothetical protein
LHYNRSSSLGVEAQARLTHMASERLPDEDVDRHAVLQTRQWRLAALQEDLRGLAEALGPTMQPGQAAALGNAFAEAADALLHVALEAFQTCSPADVDILLQATSGQGITLPSMRDRYASSISKVRGDDLKQVLHLIGLFERAVGHIRTLGQTLPT